MTLLWFVVNDAGIPTAFNASFNGEADAQVEHDLLRGVMTPVITPLTDDRELDTRSLERHVRYLLDAGVGGLWVNGTTGEFYGLNLRERARVVSECVRIADGAVPVIAHAWP